MAAISRCRGGLIVGAHPHMVQGIEQQRGLIIYSLGNFVFGGNLKLTEFEAFMLQVRLDFDGPTLRETTLTFIPVFTTGSRQQTTSAPSLPKARTRHAY